jgi:acyl-CoA hydrolase
VVSERPVTYADVESCVDATIRRVGRRIVLGTPLGLGKANHVVNEFFRRAQEDPRLELRIFTALTPARPGWKNELERRFLEPLAKRLFGGYPELDYVNPLRRGELPDNIRVTEFFFQPAGFLDSPLAQQHYMSSNYTHVVRDVLDAGINVVAQLVAKQASGTLLSLSCNSDLTLDLAPRMREAERRGQKVALLAQVNRNLPFMYGDADVRPDYFDAIIDDAKYDFPLFAPPNLAVSTPEYLIALYVSALIRDGGTLQLGIGSLGDAVTYLLKLRHERNEIYRDLLSRAGVLDRFGDAVESLGGTGVFEEGLYGATEMLVQGFLELYRCGILKRRVHNHVGIQRLLSAGKIGEQITPATLERLAEAGLISTRLTPEDFSLLQALGVLKPGLAYEAGSIRLEDGTLVAADLRDARAADEICQRCLGTTLKGTHVAHACFFLGPQSFYDALRRLDRGEREQICMTGIAFVNQLYGQEELKRLQRKEARFINTGLVVTLLGAVSSDALEDGRVLSGVGGQYNFVTMAQALEDGRSILLIRSTREERGRPQSNIRASHANTTIPRHLRDVVVTEYGIAILRGHTDEEVATALVQIADSRFQEALLGEAQRTGKVAKSYRIPDRFRSNRPERLDAVLASYRARGLFPRFPLGTDFTPEEVVLMEALKGLKRIAARKRLPLPRSSQLRKVASIPESAQPYLQRMGLDAPRTLQERFLQRTIVYALASVEAI